ncbi:MAG: precorrin-8X methylmutase [bacterium]
MFDYVQNPQAIETASFQQIRQLTALEGLSDVEQQVAMRIVHTTGLPEIVQHLRLSEAACEQGLHAIQANAPILCDVEMVKQGITRRFFTESPERLKCFLNDPRVPILAKQRGETRTMAALHYWQPYLSGSIVLIGNAPTALFRLLEILAANPAQKPRLIIAMPVGFIGAAESKQALWQLKNRLNLDCITLLGRQGGSAVTAAALNALLRYHHGERY